MDGLEALRERVLGQIQMAGAEILRAYQQAGPEPRSDEAKEALDKEMLRSDEARLRLTMEAIAEYHRPSIEAECAHDWRVMHQGRAQNSVYNPGHGPQSYVWLWYCAKCREVEEGQFDR